jgi:hypothetical protein
MADHLAPNRRAVLLGGIAAALVALAGSSPAAATDYSEEFQSRLPRCGRMDGSTLRIVPSYTEAGWFTETNCLTITDGERTAVYVPYKVLEGPSEVENG